MRRGEDVMEVHLNYVNMVEQDDSPNPTAGCSANGRRRRRGSRRRRKRRRRRRR
jgi:hypothetical protein